MPRKPRDYPDCRPAFIMSSRAWYADAVCPSRGGGISFEMTFGQFADEGGCAYEFTATWIELRDGHPPAMKLGIFADAFEAFDDPAMSPLFAWLADRQQSPTPDDVAAYLLAHDFADQTPYTNPAAPPVPAEPQAAEVHALREALRIANRRIGT